MRAMLILLLLSTVVAATRADDLVLTLLAGSESHVAGQTVRVEIVALNPGAFDAAFAMELTPLRGTLAIDEQHQPVRLTPVQSPPVVVPAGGFAVRRYELTLPAGLTGDAVLTVERDDAPPLRTVLSVAAAAAPLANATTGERRDVKKQDAVALSPLERLASATPASSSLARNFSGRFLPNQPIYFVYGDSEQAAKFQFSFDYRLATITTNSVTRPRTDTVRIGYTQRSVWDLDGDSSPFYDTSYMPEVAFNRDMPVPENPSRWFTWLGWRAAVQHESNGREGDDSRSLNTVYFRPRFVVGTLGEWAFVVLPELQLYLGESEENTDIEDYRGHGKLRLYFGHNKGPSVQLTAWAGKDLEHGTWQLDLAVPTRVRWLNLETYFYAQYFNGYGESLRDYRRRSDALRAGIALVR